MRIGVNFIFFVMVLAGYLFVFARCTDFIAGVDRQDDWKVIESGKIQLYYRAGDFSSAPSPGQQVAGRIVQNQNVYYQGILKRIQVSFTDKVMIYLYNEDEADELIGTNTGGHAIPKYNTYYYTYMSNRRSFIDQYGIEDPVIGAHELAHVITHRTMGYPGTRLMSEGYAVWLDGFYGGYPIEDIIRKYRDEETDKLMSPEELLDEKEDSESVFYPNAGMLIRFWTSQYGVVNINRLFTSSEDEFKKHFMQAAGESWEDMTSRYDQYLQSL